MVLQLLIGVDWRKYMYNKFKMNRFVFLIVSAAVLLFTGACGTKNTINEDVKINENTEKITFDEIKETDSYDSLKKFSYDFFEKGIEIKNPVYSPVSAYIALSMVGYGADNNTYAEFEEIFGSDMANVSSSIMKAYHNEGKIFKLLLANSAWIDDDFSVNKKWIENVEEGFNSDIFNTNLSGEKTMKKMNSWIEDNTKGMIQRMLETPLGDDSKLALFNTVYFKSRWETPFEVTATHKKKFYLEDGKGEIEVDTLNASYENFDYIKNDFADGIILNYNTEDSGLNLAYVAIKPTNESSIRDVCSKLTIEVIDKMIENRKTELVNLSLPKYSITCDQVLNEILKKQGLSDAFDSEKADFSKLGSTSNDKKIYIDLVRQKSKIIVDEEGTEAAAVTEVIMTEGCALIEEKPIDVRFDRPFLYMIMDMDKNIPLFIGILDEPVTE